MDLSNETSKNEKKKCELQPKNIKIMSEVYQDIVIVENQSDIQL